MEDCHMKLLNVEGISEILTNMLVDSGEDVGIFDSGYERGYFYGFHDAIVCVMKRLGVQNEETLVEFNR